MFQQAGTAQLNDYFRPLSERGGSRVFFCRIAGYGETVAAFLRRYYEAARRSGVIIDGRIPNPTPDNLSYFNEMMGSGFQMDRDFLSQRLKKWLPRMTDGQRDAVVTAMYATLDDMRRAGKNDNMLRNAYMKYMCWLYYKFERIVNVLGGETLPKILYAGDVSHYELQLLTVLSRAGADIVLLECGGDQAYLTVDPQSALSHLYQAPGLGSFPAGFGVKQLQAELEREVRRQRLYGTPPSLSPCTNAWVQKAELNAALTAVQARGNDPRFFCNLFLCQYGVEDNLTYTNDLFAFYQSLQGGGRRICVVNGDPAPPGPEEIAAVKRGNYASAEQLAAGLAANIRYPANVELQRLMTRAFIDLVLEEGERCGGSVSKLTSRAVYLLCWLNRYQKDLFPDWKAPEVAVFLQFGEADFYFGDGSVVYRGGGLRGLQCSPDYGSPGLRIFQRGFGFHYAYLIFAVVQYKQRVAFAYFLMLGEINLLDITRCTQVDGRDILFYLRVIADLCLFIIKEEANNLYHSPNYDCRSQQADRDLPTAQLAQFLGFLLVCARRVIFRCCFHMMI